MRLTRRTLLRRAAGSVIGLSLARAVSAGNARRPNVLFIMTDQHNAHALGCYGNKQVQTPNMDRLASEGVLFERAFCQTGQCVPSRYSIWTGRYPRSHGTYSNGMKQNPQEKTVAELFKPHGYVTATIGKHHMQMNTETNKHGFDVVFEGAGGRRPEMKRQLPYDEVHPGRAPVGEYPLSNEQHPCGVITDKALQFVRENKDRPFVLWYSFHGPHTPITPSAPWSQQYDANELTLPPNHKAVDEKLPNVQRLLEKSGAYSETRYHRETLAYYYGLVSQIDYNIGRVLDELDTLGLTDNTIVVYTADHGEMMSEHQAWTKGGTGYDATIRVPLILRMPSALPAGRRIKELACSIDLLPTLLELARIDVPDDIDGISLVPHAQAKPHARRSYAFSQLAGCIVVRSENYKYVRYAKGEQIEYEQFFDLRKDPWETENRIDDASYAEHLAAHKRALEKWQTETPAVPPQPMIAEKQPGKKPAAQRKTRPRKAKPPAGS